MVLGPGINIQRDPRWGRNFEMFSEDPLLTSALGTADIEGIQSQEVMADVKHFVTYNQETNRATPYDDTIVNPRALHEIYLPPFYGAIEQAHAASVMCAYPLLNGVYSCQNPSLLTGLLDDRWGFQGFVRSDSAANASTVNSANAGLDQERGSFYWDNGQLAAAVADGQVRSSTITQAVTADPDPDVPVRSIQQSAHREPIDTREHPGRQRLCSERRPAGNGAAAKHREHLAAEHRDHKVDRGDRPRRDDQSSERRYRKLLRHAVVSDQSAQRNHRPCRLCGDGHVVFRHRSDPGCRHCPAGPGRDRVRELLGGRRERPDEHLAAQRSGRDDRSGRRRQPEHDRRAEHRRAGADAVAEQRQRRCWKRGTRGRTTAPRSHPCCSATSTQAATSLKPSQPACRRSRRRRRLSSPG